MFISFVAIVIIFLHFYLIGRMPKYRVYGFVKPGFEKVRQVYESNFNTKLERGSGFAAYYKGELVVHLYGGLADPKKGDLWKSDTIGYIFSCTKAIGAVCLATLVDKGLLDYDQLVSHYWPEFAANGKDKIKVKTLLSHTAGLWTLDEPITPDEILTNWKSVSRKLANQPPAFDNRVVYHSLTIGMYMDELMRRIDGRSIGKYFDDEIAKPNQLDIAVVRKENQKSRRVSVAVNWMSLISLLNPRYYNLTWFILRFVLGFDKVTKKSGSCMNGIVKRTDVPCVSVSGVATVESAAKLYSLLMRDGCILAKQTVEQLCEPLVDHYGLTTHKKWSFGYGLSPLLSPRNTWMFGSPGFGGQMIYGDPKYDLSFAYLTSSISPFSVGDDARHLSLQKALYDCID